VTNDVEVNDAIASCAGNVAIVKEPCQIINKPDEFVMNSHRCILSLRDAGNFNKIHLRVIDRCRNAGNQFPARETKFVVDNTIPRDFEIPKKDRSSEKSLASESINRICVTQTYLLRRENLSWHFSCRRNGLHPAYLCGPLSRYRMRNLLSSNKRIAFLIGRSMCCVSSSNRFHRCTHSKEELWVCFSHP